MKQIDRLIMRAREQNQRANPKECLYLIMVTPKGEEWIIHADLGKEADRNKCPCPSWRRITLTAPTKEVALEKVQELERQYHSDKVDAPQIILDDIYAE